MFFNRRRTLTWKIKQKQTNRDFDQLKDENQDLYQQVGTLQKKHDKQQDTVDRLISFMIHFIQQSGGVSLNKLKP